MSFQLNTFYFMFSVSLVTILNLNIFFGFIGEVSVYVIVELSMIFYVMGAACTRSVSIDRPSFRFVGLMIMFALISSVAVAEKALYGLFYSLSLSFKIIFVLFFMQARSTFYLSKRFVRLAVWISLFITLSSSLAHYYFFPNGIAPGWVWPLNISMQELVLLIFYMSFFLLNGFRHSYILIAMLVALVFLRGSGKTTLVLFLGFSIIFFLSIRFSAIRFVVQRAIYIYYAFFLIGVIALLVFWNDEIVSLHNNINELMSERPVFFKRASLIIEGLFHLTEWKTVFLGSGFGVVNYLVAVDSKLQNTPQIFILTQLAYGGLVFVSLYFLIILRIRSLWHHIFNQRILVVYFSVCLLCILTFLTTHEYFNNPLFYLSLFVLFYSFQVAARLDNDRSAVIP